MKTLLYIVGVPGSGKSTVVREFIKLGGYDAFTQVNEGCPHIVYRCHGDESTGMPPTLVELGVRRSQFPGTDGLSMSILPKALAFLSTCPFSVILGEGDRLNAKRFFEGARAAGWDVHIVLLDMPQEVAAARRAARGSRQNEGWIRGRETKVANMAKEAKLVITVDESTTAQAAAVVLQRYVAGLMR